MLCESEMGSTGMVIETVMFKTWHPPKKNQSKNYLSLNSELKIRAP